MLLILPPILTQLTLKGPNFFQNYINTLSPFALKSEHTYKIKHAHFTLKYRVYNSKYLNVTQGMVIAVHTPILYGIPMNTLRK
jgi:hypothetical protein